MTTGTEPVRVAVYARCSAVRQAEKELSIPAQLDAARTEARKKGWCVVAEFVDEAESARTANRPEFRRMISEARRKPRPFDGILVWKFSRFARNQEDSVLYKAMLARHGVRLVSLNEPVDESPAGRMMEGILEVLDEFYSANLAEDTVRGMKKNASLGFHNGGVTPLGYRVKHSGDAASPKGRLDPDPDWAPVVKRLFAGALAGKGAATLARELNAEGVKTPPGGVWTTQRVLYLLRNETYTGVRCWGRKRGEPEDQVRTEDTHPALVSKEDWQKVQVLLDARSLKAVNPKALAGQYLLTGLMVCGECGQKYVGHPSKSGGVCYYACQRKTKAGAVACSGK